MSNARNLARLLPDSSGLLPDANLAVGSITNTKIADGAVTSAKIATTVNGFGTRTVSTSSPTGGSDGDIWYKV